MSDRVLSADGQVEINRKQVTLLYQNQTSAILGALGLALFISIALWDVVNRDATLIWGGAILVISIFRLWHGRSFQRDFESHSLAYWRYSFLILVFLAGVIWGAFLFFYSPNWPVQHQFMAWIIYPGLITGAVASLSGYYPAFVVFVSPLIASCAWVLVSLGRAEYGMMLFILILFFISILLVAKRANHTLVDALEARGRLAEINRKLTQMATRDVLTGVPNRRAFEHQLQREWGRALRCNNSIALLMADVDHFKNYNDRFGHSVGDSCLKQVASAIAGEIHRSCDFAARFGGEEFALLLPDTDHNGAVKVAENILKAVRELPVPGMATGQGGAPLTVSIGVGCCTPTAESNSQSLMDEADQALYRAKRSGRNCVL